MPEAKRGQQHAGVAGSADLANTGRYSVEVKGCERLDLHAAVKQSQAAAETRQLPIVYWKRNNRDPLIVMDADTFRRLHELIESKNTPGAPA